MWLFLAQHFRPHTATTGHWATLSETIYFRVEKWQNDPIYIRLACEWNRIYDLLDSHTAFCVQENYEFCLIMSHFTYITVTTAINQLSFQHPLNFKCDFCHFFSLAVDFFSHFLLLKLSYTWLQNDWEKRIGEIDDSWKSCSDKYCRTMCGKNDALDREQI